MLIDFLIDCHLPKRKSYIFVIVQYISFSVKDYFPTKIAFFVVNFDMYVLCS